MRNRWDLLPNDSQAFTAHRLGNSAPKPGFGFMGCSMARAHYEVAKAIKVGELVRPAACEECGNSPPPNQRGAAQIQAHHHKGYERPLDVQWHCPLCHNRANGKGKPGRVGEPDPLGSILDDDEPVVMVPRRVSGALEDKS